MDVKVTSDGSYATCFVSFFTNAEGEEKTKQENEVLAGLESAKGLMKKKIGHEIRLRHVPELVFKMDRSLDYGRHIDEVLSGLNIKHDDDEEE